MESLHAPIETNTNTTNCNQPMIATTKLSTTTTIPTEFIRRTQHTQTIQYFEYIQSSNALHIGLVYLDSRDDG